MLPVLLGIVVGCVVLYVIWTLSTSYGSEYKDNTFDAFVDNSNDKLPNSQKNKSDNKVKYFSSYTEPGFLVLIIYGTEYGFSEEIAMTVFDRIEKLSIESNCPWQPRLVNACDYRCVDFSQEHITLMLISTAGDGVPPSDAREFYTFMMESADSLNMLNHLHYSVLAMGDSNYPHFCRTGRSLDRRFEELGAKRLTFRSDIDQEDWTSINDWISRILEELTNIRCSVTIQQDYLEPRGRTSEDGFDRNLPFMATMKVKMNLTVCENVEDKETIHCEFDLTGSGLTWMAGDALGIYPTNNPSEVDQLLCAMNCSGKEPVSVPRWAYQPGPGSEISLREALMKYYDLKTVKPDLLKELKGAACESGSQQELYVLLQYGDSKSNRLLFEYLSEREVVDVLRHFTEPAGNLTLNQILGHMKSLQPRYYSISSSPMVDRNTACVTAAVVRYVTLGHSRTGVMTTFLQDRLKVGQSCPIFISQNPEFRLPEDFSLPVIMIGPGTGIAPFRAFMQERVLAKETGHTVGKSLLYFGCRHKDKDFVYRNELEDWCNKGHVDLRVAFSRDQDQKVYVQQLMAKDAGNLWQLVDKQHAHIYVCGDAKHMAHDVHSTLLSIVQSQGGIGLDEADTYLLELEQNGRYQKDVWIT